MAKPDLAGRLGIDSGLLEGLAAISESVTDDGATLRAGGFVPGLGREAESAWEEARARLAGEGLAVSRRDELGLDPELAHALLRTGRLIAVTEDLLYPPETLDALVGLVGTLPHGFTVAEFRDATGITRRHAVPLLEWLDARGVTRREGDGRVVRGHG
jgi:selenocysteine-specific elongation factor